jgi:hypothetical protein
MLLMLSRNKKIMSLKFRDGAIFRDSQKQKWKYM